VSAPAGSDNLFDAVAASPHILRRKEIEQAPPPQDLAQHAHALRKRFVVFQDNPVRIDDVSGLPDCVQKRPQGLIRQPQGRLDLFAVRDIPGNAVRHSTIGPGPGIPFHPAVAAIRFPVTIDEAEHWTSLPDLLLYDLSGRIDIVRVDKCIDRAVQQTVFRIPENLGKNGIHHEEPCRGIVKNADHVRVQLEKVP